MLHSAMAVIVTIMVAMMIVVVVIVVVAAIERWVRLTFWPIGRAEPTPDVTFDATSVALNATHVTFWPRTV